MKNTRFGGAKVSKFISIFLVLSLFTQFVVFLPIPVKAVAVLPFTDGFESSPNHFLNWTAVGDGWHDESDNNSGSKSAEVKNTDSGELRKDISTLGYENVALSYWYKIPGGLTSQDHLKVQWSVDGIIWNTVIDYVSSAMMSNWDQAAFNLPAGAKNNSGFRFRFLAEDFEKSDKFRVDDVTLTGDIIPPPNNPPVLDAISNQTMDEMAAGTFTASATDADGDTLTYSLSGAPAGASIDPNTGVFSWTPTEAEGPGVYTFNVIVSDGNGGTDSKPVTITVNEVNAAPVADNAIVATHQNVPKIISLVAVDSDSPANALVFSIVSNPLNGILGAISGNQITYTPNADYLGPDSFSFRATDDGIPNMTGDAVVNISVDNSAPIIDSVSDQIIDELIALNLTVTGSDPDGDPLTFSLGGTPPSGASITSAGEFGWIPTEADGPGVYPIIAIVSDGTASDSTSFNVTVLEANVPPVATDQSINTTKNNAVSDTLAATDTDMPANALTYSVTIDPQNGILSTFDSATGAFTYTPNTDFFGSDSFAFKANDGAVDSNTAVVSVTVSDVPACADGIDNDQDGKIDSNDPGCSDANDNDETDSPIAPVTPPADDGESGEGSGGGGIGGRRHDISGISGSSGGEAQTGEVLGASTGPVCEEYLTEYIKAGAQNNPEEVKKLQIFLNQFFEVKNPVTGYYGPITIDMVNKFQKHQEVAVLTPWTIAGLPTNGPTGYVYKTTKRWINILKCPEMIANSPIPPLP